MGSVYDALLLNRDDAQARRESLALRVDRACISGRSVFVPFSTIDAPPPPNTAPMNAKYGNTLTNMRRLSITGQLAKCVSLILVGIAVRGKG
jgi:hypothetical protein